MDITNVLFTRRTGEIVPNAPIADNLFGLKLSDSDVITTATGNPVSIITNKAQNAISTILSFSPKQSGSGDPSPQNIRPIEGWTEANLGVNSETPTTTISLGGTYYGFSVDVERGVLRATLAIYNPTGSEPGYQEVSGGRIAFVIPNQYRVAGTIARMCSHFAPVQTANQWCYVTTAYTVEELKDYFVNNTVQIVMGLATPLELPLTPQTVALLAGNNTIWTDGDSIEITYKAKRG